jgi:caa(3)-type oxidase subunit IV
MANPETHQSPGSVPPPNTHGHAHDTDHVAKHVKGYLVVGGVLVFCTLLTVGLSYVPFDHWFGRDGNIIVAMILATFKAGLVAAIFMHLKGERITIWRFLIFTAIFVTGLFMLTALHESNPIPGTLHAIHQ